MVPSASSLASQYGGLVKIEHGLAAAQHLSKSFGTDKGDLKHKREIRITKRGANVIDTNIARVGKTTYSSSRVISLSKAAAKDDECMAMYQQLTGMKRPFGDQPQQQQKQSKRIRQEEEVYEIDEDELSAGGDYEDEEDD